MMFHTSKSVTCIKFKGSGFDRSSTCERKSALGINTVSPFSIDKSTLDTDGTGKFCPYSRGFRDNFLTFLAFKNKNVKPDNLSNDVIYEQLIGIK